MGERFGPILSVSGGGGGGAVSSVNGTAGQIVVSPTTGAVVVGLATEGPGAGTANYPSSVTVDAYGRIVSFGATATPVLVGATAGGAFTGTYPNPTLNPAVPLPNGIAATTQAPGDTSTDVATDAFVAAAIIAAPMSGQYTYSIITANPNPGVVGTVYECNYAASGTFTLPTLSLVAGKWIKVIQVATNNLTFAGTVNGNTGYALTVQYESVTLIYNGTSWRVF